MLRGNGAYRLPSTRQHGPCPTIITEAEGTCTEAYESGPTEMLRVISTLPSLALISSSSRAGNYESVNGKQVGGGVSGKKHQKIHRQTDRKIEYIAHVI